MIVKTKQKITFYPDQFNPKKEFFYGEINAVNITEFKTILVSGNYFYKDAGQKINFGAFNFPVERAEAESYFYKFSSKKTDFLSALEESLYYIVLEEMVKDLSNKTGIATSDLEISEIQFNLK